MGLVHVNIEEILFLPACCFFFRDTAAPISARRSSSLHLARSASRNEISALPKRQTLRLPSAVIRRRLQDPQKCSLIDVIKPTCPFAPGIFHACV